MLRDRLRKSYAVLIIAAILGAQFWVIVPRKWEQFWYWPFMNYPMYSTPHYPGDQFSRYELWAGPAGKPELLRLIPSEDLHLTTFKYSALLREAIERDRPAVWGADETASELLARLVAGLTPGQPVRLQIWQQTWTVGPSGLEDRDGVRELKGEWTPTCEVGVDAMRCSGETP